ncbi:MAG: M20/M25/M40 family metallo-hydrolase [Planctomycetota bacterium]|nr:MAG: M20/M25/M40 family metallo-hydrolase [Planctomycetota bacterium]
MRIPASLLPLAGTLLAVPLPGQDPGPITGLAPTDPVCESIRALPDEELRVTEWLDELVNGIGPRLTSSSACTEACEWAARRFRDFGLEQVRLEAWGEWPVGFDRRGMKGRVVEPAKVPLVITTRSWTPGTDGPVRGRVVRAPRNPAELAAARGTLGGCWVMLQGTRPRFGREGEGFAFDLARFLDQEGILGTLVASRGELVLTSGNPRITWEDLPHRIQITVRRDQFERMAAWLDEGREVVAEFDLDQVFVKGPIPLYNVVAEIPGAEKPEELVIVGGHIDSWDGATGTNDNGTGCATTLEAARLIAAAMRETGLRPRRTIRFMLWSGEEQGLLGSRGYIAAHPEENDRISAVIVHDGGTNVLSGLLATPHMMPMFEEVLAPVQALADAAGEEFAFSLREVEGLPRGIGSDHDSYLAAGVPGFFWRQHGESNYNRVHHTQYDTFDSAIERYQLHNARVVALAAWRFANAEGMVPRDDMGSGGRGGPRRGRRLLGVRLGEEGLVVTGLTENGQAAKLGLKAGDRIVQVGDAEVTTREELIQALRSGPPEKKVVVRRDGELLSFNFRWER